MGGKGSRFTLLFERLAIASLQEATPTAVARRLGLTWDEARGIMERAVRRGLARRPQEPVARLGVDEKSFPAAPVVSVVVDLDRACVLHVADDRKAESLVPYFAGLTPEQRDGIEAIAMDMWEPYRKTVRAHVPGADAKIVFDKFHVLQHVSDAVDQVRRQESKALARAGDRRSRGRIRLAAEPGQLQPHGLARVRGAPRQQPQIGPGVGVEGEPPPAVGLHLCRCGADVLPPVVLVGDALAARPNDQGGADAEGASQEHPYLSHAPDYQRGDGRAQRQDSVDQVRRPRLPESRGVQDGDPLPLRRP